ncbi:MAG: phosphopantetheine-binding protein [Deltaproteobacteria bacterium]|nr:phosphopantetheine-binding protein [Deltaproteobacteria bacterium]
MDLRTLDDRGLERRIAEILISELKLEDVTADTFDVGLDLVDELGIDSMDLTTVALVLQDVFRVAIDEDDYPRLKSVRAIREYIRSKIGGA